MEMGDTLVGPTGCHWAVTLIMNEGHGVDSNTECRLVWHRHMRCGSQQATRQATVSQLSKMIDEPRTHADRLAVMYPCEISSCACVLLHSHCRRISLGIKGNKR